MATIGKVSAVFSANTSGLVSGTNAAGSAFRKLSGDVSGMRSGLLKLVAIQGAQLFGQVASAAKAAATAFYNMAKGEADAIDQTSKLSRRLGMTYGELAGLSLAGDLAGVSMETIGKAATKADVAFVKAAEGSTQAKKALAGVVLKPFVLMLRLFANITAGHIIILGFFSLIFIFGAMNPTFGYAVSPLSVIFTVFMSMLELLVAFLQAFVFTLLSAIYIGMAVEEHHH